MDRRLILTGATGLVLLSATPNVSAQVKFTRITRDEFIKVFSDETKIAWMFLVVDAVRFNLALALATAREIGSEIMPLSEDYDKIKLEIKKNAPTILMDVKNMTDDQFDMIRDSYGILPNTQSVLQDGGIVTGSKINDQLIRNFDVFIKAALISSQGLISWICADYPFKVVCSKT